MKLLGKIVIWPIQWMKALPWVAVSGSMLYAAATQWAGHWAWVEAISHFRPFVLALCVVGCVLFLIGLSLGRVLIGLAVTVWLAWPMARYFLPPPQPEPAASYAPQELNVALCALRPGPPKAGAAERVLSWNADLVVLAGPSEEFYRENFQAFRERYSQHHADQLGLSNGIWCFTRLAVAKDLCKTRTKALGGAPACDWTLKLADGSSFRLVASHAPWPGDATGLETRRKIWAGLGPAFEKETNARMVVGSLACTPYSAYFQDLEAGAGLRDTALGHGLIPTWCPAWFPVAGLSLDHVLVSEHWQVVDRTLAEPLDGDHRPVLVRLRKVR